MSDCSCDKAALRKLICLSKNPGWLLSRVKNPMKNGRIVRHFRALFGEIGLHVCVFHLTRNRNQTVPRKKRERRSVSKCVARRIRERLRAVRMKRHELHCVQ